MKNIYIVLLLTIGLSLSTTEAFADSGETVEMIVGMLPALLVGCGIVFVAYLLEKVGLGGLAKVVGIIGLIIGGLAAIGIALCIIALVLSFILMIVGAAFTAAFYIGLFLLACFMIYSIFNWLFSAKK